MARFGEAKYGTSHYGMSISQAEAITLAENLAIKLSTAIVEDSARTQFGRARFGESKYGQRWSVSLLDALTLKLGRPITDAFSMADAVSTLLQHHVSVLDTMAIVEALALKTGLPVADGVALAENIGLETGKSIVEIASLLDNLKMKVSMSVADLIALMEAVGLKTGKILSETALVLADDVTTIFKQLPSVQVRYQPRPLIALTIGAGTKRYSTEDMAVA